MQLRAFLENNLSEAQFEESRKLHFKDLLDLVVAQLRDLGIPPKEIESLPRLIEEIEAVRDLRNHIAHAHLTVNIRDDQKPKVTLSMPRDLDRPFDPDTRELTLDELKSGLDRLNKVSDEFSNLSRQFPGDHQSRANPT